MHGDERTAPPDRGGHRAPERVSDGERVQKRWSPRIPQVAVDTIYLCAFKDMEENNPPKYMSNDLRKGFGFDEAQARIAREHREPTSLSFDPCLTLPEAGFNFSSNRDCHQP
eukprot:6173474-Pleurochrysis_carterae.AAC.9